MQALMLCILQAPRDKLVCILNCCRIINNLLHLNVGQGEARGMSGRPMDPSSQRFHVLPVQHILTCSL